MAQSVVLLPDPVGPVTSTRPLVSAEPGHPRNLVREVGVAALGVLRAVPLGHQGDEHGLELGLVHRRLLEPFELAAGSDHRRLAHPEVQVRAATLDQRAEEPLDVLQR
jgi:hypothetical protein